MSKKVIVLADNSYTIRRIVELSFSEIDNVEVRSFENGSGIKEKILPLAPAVIIADIKLPEVSGYDLCRFANETPALAHTRVFLMKGSFDPVDNEMIKNLKYEDIVTKPFDSNALVAAVMKIVNQEGAAAAPPQEAPSSFPEEFSEIETEAPESEDISFSDIRGDLEPPSGFERPAAASAPERDEILPSEEITQGPQFKDNLLPQESDDTFKNPFDEDGGFGEIVAAPAAAPPVAAAAPVKDESDAFHDRFMEINNEDTSEELIKAPLLNEGEEFPADAAMDMVSAPVGEETFSLSLEGQDETITVQSEPEAPPVIDIRQEVDVQFDPLLTSEPRLDRTVAKPRGESLSPQDELARLSDLTRKEPKAEPVPAAAPAKAPAAAPAAAEALPLNGKVEDRLSQSIKELLWEIVPPLAEKIIREEIERIKSDVGNNGL